MNDVVIEVENLSKMFLIGALQAGTGAGNVATRASMREMLPMIFGMQPSSDSNALWALRDVSFQIRAGEVLGVVGRNGSGKSTLLKILSRITQPTRGSFSIKGRVGSLLEVGTGFHPDLTGRQNIYLNGAILGMSNDEIKSRFDEIVEFAEIRKFLDTPVRHYSSGMYMRLAFSVSAHLDCDILLVDEVLAVGDLKFQKKCLGMMRETLGSGKTVVFVSHSTSAILQICSRAILLENGVLVANDSAHNVIERYVDEELVTEGERTWSGDECPKFEDASLRLRAIRLRDAGGMIKAAFDVKDEFEVEMEFEVVRQVHAIDIHLYFAHDVSGKLFVTMDNLDSPWNKEPPKPGLYKAHCKVPTEFLNEGMFTIEWVICTNPSTTYHVAVPDVLTFRVSDDMRNTGVRGSWEREWPPASIRPRLHWQHQKQQGAV